MSRLRRVAVLLACLPACLGEGQPASTERPGARIWVGRYQEIEDYLRTADCVRMEIFGANGPTRCTLRPGGPVARMSWKPLPPGTYRGFRESYKNEIAAYELDKLLKLDMVPPAVERQLESHTGAAQLWAEGVRDVKVDPAPAESSRAEWDNQIARMTMFDDLIGNRGRNLATTLHDGAWNLILIDHSRSFGADTELPHKLTRIDGRLWATMAGLTRPQLDAALRSWLGEDEIGAVLERREKMRAQLKSMAR